MIDSISLQALRRIGLQQSLLATLAGLTAAPEDRLMRVSEVHRDAVTLHDGHQAQLARVWPTLLLDWQLSADGLVVGDWVLARPALPDGWWVVQRCPPVNSLQRRDSSGRRQNLVANVDTALLVMTCGHDFNLRRLDRYLTLVRMAGVLPVVVLSQADLHPQPEQRVDEVLRHLGRLRLDVLALDATDPEAARRLAPWLEAGQTLVLLGSSGAGKSTLTNTLTGLRSDRGAMGPGEAAGQLTGPARQADGRGRHTTTARSLHLCPGGACIIDTPGLRGLQLNADGAQLERAFDDVQVLASACRFRDCHHGDEPGCAVRPVLAPERLLSFHKLQREAQRHEMTVLDRQQQLAEWKARSRGAQVRMRAKRG